jgi:hypothetical protein
MEQRYRQIAKRLCPMVDALLLIGPVLWLHWGKHLRARWKWMIAHVVKPGLVLGLVYLGVLCSLTLLGSSWLLLLSVGAQAPEGFSLIESSLSCRLVAVPLSVVTFPSAYAMWNDHQGTGFVRVMLVVSIGIRWPLYWLSHR